MKESKRSDAGAAADPFGTSRREVLAVGGGASSRPPWPITCAARPSSSRMS
jgi:hypothetical protein